MRTEKGSRLSWSKKGIWEVPSTGDGDSAMRCSGTALALCTSLGKDSCWPTGLLGAGLCRTIGPLLAGMCWCCFPCNQAEKSMLVIIYFYWHMSHSCSGAAEKLRVLKDLLVLLCCKSELGISGFVFSPGVPKVSQWMLLDRTHPRALIP